MSRRLAPLATMLIAALLAGCSERTGQGDAVDLQIDQSLGADGARDLAAADLGGDGPLADGLPGPQLPVTLWAVSAGGADLSSANDVVIDGAGNIYVTGTFTGSATFGTTTLTSAGERDIFIAKLSSAGVFTWAVRAGSSGTDFGRGIVVDAAGNAYVTGSVGPKAEFGSLGVAPKAMYVAKVDPLGKFQWVSHGTSTGGTISALDLAIDKSGQIYVTGEYAGTGTWGSTVVTAAGANDVFVARLDSSGKFDWVTSGGGTLEDAAWGIATDSQGNTVVAAYFHEAATFGSHPVSCSPVGLQAASCVVVASVSPAGDFRWATSLFPGIPTGHVALDTAGNAYVGGNFYGSVSLPPTTLTAKASDVFVSRVSPSGAAKWAVSAGGMDYDTAWGIAAGAANDLFVTGKFVERTASFGTDFPYCFGKGDVFVSRLDSSGSFLWTVSAGGKDYDFGLSVAHDGKDEIVAVGTFYDTAQFGPVTLTSKGEYDIFVWKLRVP